MRGRLERLRSSSSGILTATWFACFWACLVVPCIMRLQSNIESDTLMAAVGNITDAYSANLAVILGFYFHSKLNSGPRRKSPSASLLVALVATLIWNALAVGALVAALFNVFAVDEAAKMVSTVGPKLSWLVAPMLGYYFASPGETSQTPQNT